MSLESIEAGRFRKIQKHEHFWNKTIHTIKDNPILMTSSSRRTVSESLQPSFLETGRSNSKTFLEHDYPISATPPSRQEHPWVQNHRSLHPSYLYESCKSKNTYEIEQSNFDNFKTSLESSRHEHHMDVESSEV